MRIFHYLYGGGYLHFTCPQLCDTCIIRFLCYTSKEGNHVINFGCGVSYDDVVYVDDRDMFDNLCNAWGIDNFKDLPL